MFGCGINLVKGVKVDLVRVPCVDGEEFKFGQFWEIVSGGFMKCVVGPVGVFEDDGDDVGWSLRECFQIVGLYTKLVSVSLCSVVLVIVIDCANEGYFVIESGSVGGEVEWGIVEIFFGIDYVL